MGTGRNCSNSFSILGRQKAETRDDLAPVRCPGRRGDLACLSIPMLRPFSENRPAVARETEKKFFFLFLLHTCAQYAVGQRGNGGTHTLSLLYPMPLADIEN